MKNIIIAMILIAQIQSQCTDGCLSCSDKNECIVCDVTNGYYLTGSTCQMSSVENCSIYDLAGNCYICKQGYYTDPNAEQCLQIKDTGELDMNCQIFNFDRQCIQCKQGYYLLGNQCIEVPETERIEKCKMYNTKTECVECEQGSTLNLQGSKCLDNSSVQNCVEQTTVKCDKCKTGYTKNANYFLLSIQSELAQINESLAYADITNFAHNHHFFEEGCLKNIGSNCLLYQDFNKCLSCEAKHYLKDGKCYGFPKEQIQNCKIYQNQEKCIECQQGYYLTGAANCIKIPTKSFIDNCVIYNPKVQSVQCLQCKNDYFVNNANACSVRVNQINKCKDFSLNSDTCLNCQDNYKVTDDGLKCLLAIDNCMTYESSSNSTITTQFTCAKCNRGLYFNTSTRTCEPGNIKNCSFYKNDANVCVECDNKFYLKNNACVEHTTLANCGIYSQTLPDQCEKCDNKSIEMIQKTDCESVKIEGCRVYESTQTCLECEDLYDLTNKLCTKLNIESHCRRSIDGVCVLCIDQYFLRSDNKCYLPFDYEKVNCITNTNDGTKSDHFKSGCKVCKDYHIPYNLQNHNVCLSVDEFSMIQTTYEVPHCQRYKVDNLQFKCKQCEVTYVLDSANNKCIKDCPAGQFKLDFNFVNDGNYGFQYKDDSHCVTHENTKTKSVTLDKDYQVTSWKLNTGYSYLIDFSKQTNFKLVLPKAVDGVAVSDQLYKFPDYTQSDAVQPTTDTLDADKFITTKGETVEHCEYYFTFRTVKYCSKCQFGYFGQIDFYKIDNCHKYDDANEDCEECVYQYKISADKHKCTFTTVPGCSLYEHNTAKCLACDDGFYLDKATDACKKNAVENCKSHHPYKAATCLLCHEDYLLNAAQTKCAKIIDNCRKSVYKADDTTLECEQCDIGYYITSAAKTACQKGTQHPLYCWEYDDNGDCIAFRNVMETNRTNECVKPYPLDNCVEFNSASPYTCTKCDEEEYYMVGGHSSQAAGVCCKYFTYPGANQDPKALCGQTDAQNPNCRIYQKKDATDYECKECQYGYIMNPAAAANKICCPWFTQQKLTGTTKDCQSYVVAQTPAATGLTCSVFDLDTEKCKLCKAGEYFHKDKCCASGKYHDGTAGVDCSDTDIPTAENCDEYDGSNKCQKCKANYTLKHDICCNLTTQYYKATSATQYQCATTSGAIDNCDAVTSVWKSGAELLTCDTCSSGYYKVNDNKNCCKAKTDAEVWEGGACKVVKNITNITEIANCDQHQVNATTANVIKAYLCQTCSTGYPSTQGRICCGNSELFDFDESGNNVIDCRPQTFIYQNCDYIKKFNATDQFCKACKTGYYLINKRCVEFGKYMKLLRDQTTVSWTDTAITDNLTSTAAALSTSHCNQVKITAGEDSGDAKTIMKCIQCKTGYSLRVAYVATSDAETSEIPCEDSKLQNGYYDDPLNTGTLIKFDKYSKNCLLFNSANNYCQETKTDTVFKFGYCSQENNVTYYKVIKEQICCEIGKYYNSTNKACETASITNCEIQGLDNSSAAECKKCKSGYYLTNGTTCDQISLDTSLCLEFSAKNVCTRCKLGYITDGTADNECVAIDATKPKAVNCTIGDNTGANTCTTCHAGYYKSINYCCQFGTYQKATDKSCISSPISNCAKYDETTSKCTECFTMDNTFCFNSGDWKFQFVNTANSPYILEENLSGYTNYDNFKQLYLYNGGCCKEGYYYDSGSCKYITQKENCLQLDYNSGTPQCQKCEFGYYNNSGDCTKVTSANASAQNYYQSNSIYCPQGQYFDVNTLKCQYHPDTNCKESDNSYSCTTCNTGYIQSTFYIRLKIYHLAGQINGCADDLPLIAFKPCVKSDGDNYPQDSGNPIAYTSVDLLDYYKVLLRRQNCGIYDFTTQICSKCNDNYYLTDKRCCKIDEYPFYNQCIKKQTILNTCASYDSTTYKCLGCKTYQVLTNGYCCDKGHEFDSITLTCVKKIHNCDLFIAPQNLCQKCKFGFYLTPENHCCPEFTYFNINTQQCQKFTAHGMVGCKQGTENNCHVCSDNKYIIGYSTTVTGVFNKTNGKCCEEGFKYDTSLSYCVVHDAGCKIYDRFGECTECQTGLYLSVGKCCPLGTAHKTSDGTCAYLDSQRHCKKWTFATGAHTCQECYPGFNLISDNCCPFNYTWNSTNSKCVEINEIPDTLTDADYQKQLSRNCKRFESTLSNYTKGDGNAVTNAIYRCLECYDGFYMSQYVSKNYADVLNNNDYNICCPRKTFANLKDNTGCRRILKADIAEYADTGQVLTVADEQRCLEADFLYTDTISASTTYKNQIMCKRCKDNQINTWKIYDYEAAVTAYEGDNTKTLSRVSYCGTRGAAHKDNCWSHYVDSTWKVSLYCRNFDKTKYYLTNAPAITSTNVSQTFQLEPCVYGKYFDVATSTCKDIDITILNNCRQVKYSIANTAYYCAECNNGYYLDPTASATNQITFCLKKGDSNKTDCSISRDFNGGSEVCVVCNAGKGLDGSNDCQDITVSSNTIVPSYCASSSETAVTCNYCFNVTIDSVVYKTYLTGGRCCLEGQYFDGNTGEKICKGYDDCLLTADESKTIKECRFCNFNKGLFVVSDGTADGKCCLIGTVYNSDTEMCEIPTKARLSKCKYFKDDATCRVTTTYENAYLTTTQQYPCQDSANYYLNNGSCCENGKFYSTGDTCSDPTASTVQVDCKKFKVDSITECAVCKDTFYLNNNQCCADGKYYKTGTTCDDINTTNIPGVDTDCKQYIDGKCTKCGTGSVNTQGCCGTNFRNSAGECTAETAITNCAIQYQNKCIYCDNGYHMQSNKCCQYGQFISSGTCSSTGVDADCLVPKEDAAATCLLCKFGFKAIDGKCCENGKLYSKKYTSCINESALLNCKTFNAAGECTACVSSATQYITNNMCCPLGQYFDTTSKECLLIDGYCDKRTDGGSNCGTCKSGYYVNPNDATKCCLEQVAPGDACRQITLVPSIKNCAKFDTNSKCTECQTGYNLYEQVCCESGKVLVENGIKQKHCTEISVLYQDCLQFDPVTLQCKTCDTGKYNSNDQKICCPDNQHFDLDKMKCIDNHSGCKYQKDDQCTTCKTGFYLGGRYAKRCCQDTQYYNDDENKCVDIPIENCDQMTYSTTNSKYECTKCATNSGNTSFNTFLTNGHCCFGNQFWDPKALKCSNPIKYCTSYKKDSSTPVCLTCVTGRNVLKDSNKCCPHQKLYFSTREDEDCYTNAPLKKFSWVCTVYDPVLFKCKACRDGYYLMNDHCCKNGTFHKTADFSTDFQTCTGTFTDANCIQGSAAGTCTKCKFGYALNGTACVQIYDNCKTFDASVPKCTECDKDYFLTATNHCCGAGKKRAAGDTQCENITTITNCVQLNPTDATKCKICEEGYYLLGDKTGCCQHRKYCADKNTSVAGTIQNCEQYGTGDKDCTICLPDHSLLTLTAFNGVTKYCYSTPFSDCEHSAFIANANGKSVNRFQCTQCPKDRVTKDLTTEEKKWIRHYLIERCWITNTKREFQDSTLQCKYCDYDYYLKQSDATCVARTNTFTDNCAIRDWFADKCVRCEKGYYLSAAKSCLKQSVCEYEVENSTGSAKCAKCVSTRRFVPNGSMSLTAISTMPAQIVYNCETKTDAKQTLIDDFKPEADPPGYFPGLINKCERHYQCKEDFVNGLDINLHKYLSCHVCLESDRIPFISLDLDKVTNNIVEKGIKRFYYKNIATDALDKYNKNRNAKLSQCFKADLSEFPVSGTASNFPSNCAVGILNSSKVMNVNNANQSTGIDPDQLGVFCAACKPGFKPLFSNITYHVYQCQAIANCVTTGDKKSKASFNQCDHCQTGFYHPYTTANGVDKTVCYKENTKHDPNCYAYDTANKQCKVCLNGYSKNYEDKCEKLSIPFCKNSVSNFKVHLLKTDYELAFYRGVEDCKECQQNYLPLYRDIIDDYTCIYSQYARDNVFVTDNQKYTSNCKRYYQEGGKLICDTCMDNFIMTNLKQCIAINSKHENCEIALDINNCFKCNDQTVLVQGVCLAKTIENCLTYQQGKEKLLCESCIDGFYLKEQVCYQGEIQNCTRYTSENVCTACKPDYQLIQNKDSKYFCMHVISDLNCKDWQETNFNSMQIRCNTCENKHYLNLSPAKQPKVCLPLYTIDGCMKYNVNTSYANSTLMCDECQVNMYLSNGKCILRTMQINGCLENDPVKDACKVCRDGFYLSVDQMSCIPNPSGTVSCAIFNEREICILCKSSFYLKDNKCFALPVTDSINNCEAYDDQKRCMKCLDNFVLEDNECKPKNISNCMIYVDSQNCQMCEIGFGVEAKDGKQICVAIPVVSNCIKYNTTSPFACNLCEKNYYLKPSDNQCVAVENGKLIENCVYYNDNQSCRECDSSHVLSVDSKKCSLLNYPSNCVAHVEVSNPFCIKCNVGYSLNPSYECVEGPQKQIENCLVTQQNDSKVCALCRPGYFMKQDKKCYALNQNDSGGSNNNDGNNNNTGTDTNNNTGTDNTSTSGESVYRDLWIYLSTLLMMLF